MSVIGTFSSFTTARLAIYASQASLNVTGNNIANINTTGYTRQRMDLVSLYAKGAGKYANIFDRNIGYGVLTQSVSQLRDPYLDIRFRDENSKLGQVEEKLDGLYQMSQILDEVGKGTGEKEGFGVIEAQFATFLQSLQDLDVTVGSEEYDDLVRSEADILATYFNSAAKDLETIRQDKIMELNEDITEVNRLLTNIRDLNDQIRTAGIYGERALELRDARNLALDELSKYMHINVEYSMERIDQFTEVEKLTVTIPDSKGADGKPVKLIDGIYGGQISLMEKEPVMNPGYDPVAINKAKEDLRKELLEDGTKTSEEIEAEVKALEEKMIQENGKYLKTPADPDATPPVDAVYTNDVEEAVIFDEENSKYLLQVEPLVDGRERLMVDPYTVSKKSEVVELSDTILTGSLQATRELLTEEGEYSSADDLDDEGLLSGDPNASLKRGIPYYQKALDSLARKLAEIFNGANQMSADTVYQTMEVSVDADGKMVDPTDPNAAGTVTAFISSADGAKPVTDADGRVITLDDVTEEVPVLDADGNELLDEDGNPVTKRIPLTYTGDPSADPAATEAAGKAGEYLAILNRDGVTNPLYNFYDGGVMFSNNGNSNDPTGITAANISVSNAWANKTVHVLTDTRPLGFLEDGTPIESSSRNENVQHMITLFNEQIDYDAKDVQPDSAASLPIFHGSVREVFTAISGILASDQNATTAKVYDYTITSLDLENSRQSVSGVDLNDEATSMMQYSKSYAAACRLLTTIDSMLDKLINGTAV